MGSERGEPIPRSNRWQE